LPPFPHTSFKMKGTIDGFEDDGDS